MVLMSIMQITALIIESIFVFFLPGFFLSFVFFKLKKIDFFERFVYSFGISVAVVPLLVFYCNLFGIRISLLTVILEISCVFFITGALLAIQHIREGK